MPAGRATPAHFKRLQREARTARGIGAAKSPESGGLADKPELYLYRSTRWKIVKATVIANGAGICICCKHPGSNGADHIVSRAEDNTIDFFDYRNLGPVHTWPKSCPQCEALAGYPVFCNQLKHSVSLSAARRRLAQATGREIPDVLTADPPQAEGRM